MALALQEAVLARGAARLGSLFPAGLAPGVPRDPGVIGPGGATWTVCREKAILAGGPAALLLQVAHPSVAAGVTDHSDFESDPLGRLQRTLDTMLRIVFGDTSQAHDAAAGVSRVHDRVKGVSSTGSPYSAHDPELALWVFATLVVAAVDSYERLVRRLSAGQKDAFYQEYKAVGRSFGLPDDVLPADHDELRAYVAHTTANVLAVGPEAHEIARGIFAAKVVGPRWITESVVRTAAAALLPPLVGSAYGLGWSRGRRALCTTVAAASRAGLRLLPSRARYWQHYRVAMSRVAAAE